MCNINLYVVCGQLRFAGNIYNKPDMRSPKVRQNNIKNSLCVSLEFCMIHIYRPLTIADNSQDTNVIAE